MTVASTMDAPWPKGNHPEHVGFVIEVHVRRDASGALSCQRRLQDETDVRATQSLRTGGMEEGAWALLTEAARTEIMLQLLVKMTNDAEFQGKVAIDTPASEELIAGLAASTMSQMQRELRDIVPEVVREAVRILQGGLRSQAG